MELATHSKPAPAIRWQPSACVLAAALGSAVTMAASAARNTPDLGQLQVRFERDCTGATIYPGRAPLELSLEIVLDNGDVERLARLEPAASYVVRLASEAIAAGRQIASMTARASNPTAPDTSPESGPGDGPVFECKPMRDAGSGKRRKRRGSLS